MYSKIIITFLHEVDYFIVHSLLCACPHLSLTLKNSQTDALPFMISFFISYSILCYVYTLTFFFTPTNPDWCVSGLYIFCLHEVFLVSWSLVSIVFSLWFLHTYAFPCYLHCIYCLRLISMHSIIACLLAYLPHTLSLMLPPTPISFL